MSKPLRTLLVEDSDDDAQLILRMLRRGDYDVTHQRVETAEAMQAALKSQPWDVVLSDFSMPHFSGSAALETLKSTGLDIPFLVVSGKIGEEKAVEMMRNGACDYVLKDNLTRLAPAVERELHEALGRRERRLLEEQFRQAQKMEALGQLAGGVVHDFNNLITIISGFSEIMLAKLSPDDPSRGFLEQIKMAGDRSATLARQLLIFSRKHTPEPRLLDLNAIITGVEKMLRRFIREDITLSTELGAGLREVTADPGAIEQVLMNLVTNARDAMPQGGGITIRTRNLTIGEKDVRPVPAMPLGSYVMLEVSDTGCGMSEEVMTHIFEPFFTTKEPGKGTGLGLATVFGIVKQSAGHLAVDSRPNEGSTFRIFFPEAINCRSQGSGSGTVDVEVPSRGKEEILLAEDDDSVRDLIRQVLIKNGYTVLEARNGQEALDLANGCQAPINALITDVVMPVMGGHELADKLKRLHPETRVLFMSGYTNDPTVHKDGALREASFLLKPVSPAALTIQLRQLIDETRPIPSVAASRQEVCG